MGSFTRTQKTGNSSFRFIESAGMSLTITQPIGGTVSDASYEIQWTSVNISTSKTVKIEWIKGIETGLIAEVLNTGSYTWNNVSLDGGDYQIKLSLVEV